MVMGKIVGPKGHLYIFEPYSFSNKLVTHNALINGISDHTTIYKQGASNEASVALLQIKHKNTGGSQIISNGQKGWGKFDEAEAVAINTIDSTLPEGTVLDFALLDVERLEVKVLLGMKNTIQNSPNLIIMAEWQYAGNGRSNETQTMELLDFFE